MACDEAGRKSDACCSGCCCTIDVGVLPAIRFSRGVGVGWNKRSTTKLQAVAACLCCRTTRCRIRSVISWPQSVQKAKYSEHHAVLGRSCLRPAHRAFSASHCDPVRWLKHGIQNQVLSSDNRRRRCLRVLVLLGVVTYASRTTATHVLDPRQFRHFSSSVQ